ncbi:MAG: hypothetical protein FJW96_02745 [Actinobacteria bacterium]|nr:hypothetical protein [Actinomycetota bacterium]
MTAGFVAAGLLASCSYEPSVVPAYLFILDAPDGEIIEGTAGFELVLPADQKVTWFTDRPLRQAGTIDLSDLAATWEADGFIAVPPQAALDLFVDGSDETFVVELGAPRLDGDSYFFPLSDVQLEDTSMVPEHAGRTATMDVVAGQHEEISMFINSTNSCSICEVTGA